MRFQLYEEYARPTVYAVILIVGNDACHNRDYQDASRGKRSAPGSNWHTEAVAIDRYFDDWTYVGRVHEHAFPDKHNPLHRAEAEHGRYDWVTMFVSPRTNSIEEARKMFEDGEKAYFSSRSRAFGVYNFSKKRFDHVDLQESGHFSTLTTNTAKAFNTAELRIEGQMKEEALIDLLVEVYPEEMERWRGHLKSKKFGF